jgi:trans-aconitate 2-methyltransferase
MNNNSNNSWDAPTYDKISINVQLEWGRRLIENRQWVGNEIVMDAGAGSGNLTRFLADKVPNGEVYAVDADPNMIEQAKSNLSGYKNVQVIHSSMEKVDLPTKVDVIFSNSAIHWILDQDSLFSRFWHLLKPYDGGSNGSGELLIECGSHGNIESAISIIMKISRSDQFKEHFVDWKQSWYFPKPEETERMLHRAKFREIQVNVSKLTTTFSDRESFANFIKTIMTKPFLGYLPDAKMKEQFLCIFLNEFERLVSTWSLDFTRLLIFAKK